MKAEEKRKQENNRRRLSLPEANPQAETTVLYTLIYYSIIIYNIDNFVILF